MLGKDWRLSRDELVLVNTFVGDTPANDFGRSLATACTAGDTVRLKLLLLLTVKLHVLLYARLLLLLEQHLLQLEVPLKLAQLVKDKLLLLLIGGCLRLRRCKVFLQLAQLCKS